MCASSPPDAGPPLGELGVGLTQQGVRGLDLVHAHCQALDVALGTTRLDVRRAERAELLSHWLAALTSPERDGVWQWLLAPGVLGPHGQQSLVRATIHWHQAGRRPGHDEPASPLASHALEGWALEAVQGTPERWTMLSDSTRDLAHQALGVVAFQDATWARLRADLVRRARRRQPVPRPLLGALGAHAERAVDIHDLVQPWGYSHHDVSWQDALGPLVPALDPRRALVTVRWMLDHRAEHLAGHLRSLVRARGLGTSTEGPALLARLMEHAFPSPDPHRSSVARLLAPPRPRPVEEPPPAEEMLCAWTRVAPRDLLLPLLAAGWDVGGLRPPVLPPRALLSWDLLGRRPEGLVALMAALSARSDLRVDTAFMTTLLGHTDRRPRRARARSTVHSSGPAARPPPRRRGRSADAPAVRRPSPPGAGAGVRSGPPVRLEHCR